MHWHLALNAITQRVPRSDLNEFNAMQLGSLIYGRIDSMPCHTVPCTGQTGQTGQTAIYWVNGAHMLNDLNVCNALTYTNDYDAHIDSEFCSEFV